MGHEINKLAGSLTRLIVMFDVKFVAIVMFWETEERERKTVNQMILTKFVHYIHVGLSVPQ